MSKPFIVEIPHRLGRDEALRRLKSGLTKVRTNYSHLISIQEETWEDNRLSFRVGAIGQTASGTLDVLEDHVTLVVQLPWLLARFAAVIQPLVRKEGTLMLEKK